MLENLVLTRHAADRSRQRGITYEAIDVVLDFGREEAMNESRHLVFMDRAARREARRALGSKTYARLEPRLDIMVVIGSDGTAVTCMHRGKRPKRFS